MNRSRPAVRDAIKFIQDGGIGKVYMARGLCFKPRPAIGKYPDGPMAPGEKYTLNVESTTSEPTCDAAVPVQGRLRPVARPGAEAAVQPQPLPLQLALALGLRQRRHRQPGPAPVRHRALGPRQAGAPGEGQLDRRLLRPRVVAGDAEHADVALRVRRRHDPRVRHARRAHQRRGHVRRSATSSTAPKGWLWIDGDGRKWQSYMGRSKNEKGPGSDAPQPESGGSDPLVLTSIESPHYQNFVDAIRANDPKMLTCDILEGHLSSTLPHLANISYRVGRQLTFDGKTETVRQRQGGRQAADARVPQGLRDRVALPTRNAERGVRN